jgi:two-component system, cell cycle sensor histidine kinase and response regulator CckA
MEDQAKTKTQLIAELNELRSGAEEQDQLLGQVLDSVPEGIIVCGRDLRYRFWNRFMEEVTGVPASKILGQRPQEVFPFLSEVGIIDKLDQALAGMVTVPTEFAYSVPESGRSGWASDESIPLRNGDGEVIGGIAIVRDITERKEAEKELRESKARFVEAFRSSPSMAAITRMTDGRIVDVSEAFAKGLGYRREQLIGRTTVELDIWADREERDRFVKELDGGAGPCNCEIQVRTKSGQSRTVLFSGERIYLNDESHLMTTAIDITERKRAEKALAHSHSLMSYVIEHSRSAIAVHDRELRYVYVSQRYLREYNVAEHDVIGKHHYDVFPDLPQKWRDVHQKALAGEISSAEDDPYVREDGTVDWTRWECRPWYEADGSIGGIIVYTEVITQRKREEEALRIAERQYRDLFDQANEGLLLMALDGEIAQVNRAFAEMHGYTVLELKSMSIADLDVLGERAIADRADVVRRVKDGEVVRFDVEHYHKDGHIFPISVATRMVSIADQPLYLTSHRDITERKRLERRLRQTEKMDAIGQLAGGVAHDFNNQLGGIMSYADLLLAKIRDEELRTYIEAIIQSCTRSKDLTGQLLAFSRKGQYQVVPVSIHRIVDEVVSMLGHSIDRRIQIRQRLAANPPTTIGDPTQLENALLNLGLNARDAMPEGGELVFATDTVTLDEEHCRNSSFGLMPGEYVRIKVTDSGTGMGEDTRSKVFEPFFTTKEQGKGTGMGLAAVFGTVVNHRGAVEVESEIGRGTTMTVCLPLSREEPREAEAGTHVATQAAAGSASARILVVDDEESVRECTATMLRHKGYRVVTCKDGAEAIDYYGKSWQRIDLVILDMNMPVMNGHDAFIAMRGINAGIRAMLATGYSLDDNAQEILHEGALSYIQKPFRMHELFVQVEQALGG